MPGVVVGSAIVGVGVGVAAGVVCVVGVVVIAPVVVVVSGFVSLWQAARRTSAEAESPMIEF